jgi:hypothetical protein
MKQLCSVSFKLNNLVPLERHNFALFCGFIDHFYGIGFHSQMHQILMQHYKADNEESRKAEVALGFGVSWIRGLLDNPSIWVSDMLFSDRDSEQTG